MLGVNYNNYIGLSFEKILDRFKLTPNFNLRMKLLNNHNSFWMGNISPAVMVGQVGQTSKIHVLPRKKPRPRRL